MINAKMKSMFFDREGVMDKVDAGTRKWMSRFGSFVRTRSRQSIRKRKASAPPGSPPSSHTGKLKSSIYFGYDQDLRTVTIGPIVAEGTTGEGADLLENGGTTTIIRRGKRVRAKCRGNPM